jgi:phage terminase Nu1 subunit (DNA packaging protein)
MGKIVNQRELAEIVGVANNTLQAWRSEGMPCLATADKKGQAARYDTAAVIDWLRGRAAGSAGEDTINARYEQARLTKLKADNEALDVAQKEGTLIEAAAVAEVWDRLLGNFRSRLLSLPSGMADELAPLTDPREIQAVLKIIINQVLEELANADAEEICSDTEENFDF